MSKAKRGRPVNVEARTAILIALKANPGATLKELEGASVPLMSSLAKQGLVVVKGTRKADGRGRPAFEFGLSKSGHDRVRRILAKQNQVQDVAVA